MDYIIGMDEVGRGAFAGPLCGAAVVIDPEAFEIVLDAGLKDSKKLSALRRKYLLPAIKSHAREIIIKEISVEYINKYGMGVANQFLFESLIKEVYKFPGRIIIDGRLTLVSERQYETRVRGDASVPAIMAASVVAKVHRDNLMKSYAQIWPEYGFDIHKGYGTRRHREALKAHGPCSIHRLNFKPVATINLSGCVGQ